MAQPVRGRRKPPSYGLKMILRPLINSLTNDIFMTSPVPLRVRHSGGYKMRRLDDVVTYPVPCDDTPICSWPLLGYWEYRATTNRTL